jgi:hypothetical protein
MPLPFYSTSIFQPSLKFKLIKIASAFPSATIFDIKFAHILVVDSLMYQQNYL